MASTVPDETLMALADGELQGAEADAVRAVLREDPAAAAAYALFVETRLLAAEAYAGDLEDPVPQRLLDAVRAAGPSSASPPGAREEAEADAPAHRSDDSPAAIAVPQARILRYTAPPASTVPRWVMALAASVALVLGAAAGGMIAARQPGTALTLAADPADHPVLARALRELASGGSLQWQEGGSTGEVKLVATHVIGGDVLCREAELVVTGSRPRDSFIVACRKGGGWVTEMVLARQALADGTFAPASAAQEAIDLYLAGRGSAGPLSADEEAARLRATR